MKIKNIEKGRLFKDVTKIKDVTEYIMNSYGQSPKFQFLRTSSMDSVPQNQKNVTENSEKTPFSLSEESNKKSVTPTKGWKVFGKDLSTKNGVSFN